MVRQLRCLASSQDYFFVVFHNERVAIRILKIFLAEKRRMKHHVPNQGVVIEQGFPTCGTRRSSRWYAGNFYFLTKTWIHSFLDYVSCFVSKIHKISCSLLFLLYLKHYDFRRAVSKFPPRIDQFVQGKQNKNLIKFSHVLLLLF